MFGGVREPLEARPHEQTDEQRRQDRQAMLAAAYLAATYRLLEMRDEAQRLIAKVPFDAAGEADRLVYEDGAVQAARLLYLLALHFPERLRRDAVPVERLVERVLDGPVTTLSAGLGIQALAAYARVASPEASPPVRVQEIGPGGRESDLRLPPGLFPSAPLSEDAVGVKVHAGKAPVYYQVVQAGYDRLPPAEPVRNGGWWPAKPDVLVLSFGWERSISL